MVSGFQRSIHRQVGHGAGLLVRRWNDLKLNLCSGSNAAIARGNHVVLGGAVENVTPHEVEEVVWQTRGPAPDVSLPPLLWPPQRWLAAGCLFQEGWLEQLQVGLLAPLLPVRMRGVE